MAHMCNISPTQVLKAQRFQSEVENLLGVLLRRARRLTRSHTDAEDLVQNTLMHAYAGYRTFEPGANIEAWLYRIMRNQWINTYRRAQRRPFEVFDGPVNNAAVAHREVAGRPQLSSAEDRVLRSMPEVAVTEAWATLTDDHRLVLYYAAIEGYSYREVSGLLNIPMGTVMSRLHRARRQMRHELARRIA